MQSIKASTNDINQLTIDNILVKLKSMTVSRAIMTLTRDLEVQVKLDIYYSSTVVTKRIILVATISGTYYRTYSNSV